MEWTNYEWLCLICKTRIPAGEPQHARARKIGSRREWCPTCKKETSQRKVTEED